jgi:hypothetical protein
MTLRGSARRLVVQRSQQLPHPSWRNCLEISPRMKLHQRSLTTYTADWSGHAIGRSLLVGRTDPVYRAAASIRCPAGTLCPRSDHAPQPAPARAQRASIRRSDRVMIAAAPRTWPRVTGSSGWLLAGAELACACWKGRSGRLACALRAAPGSPATAGSCRSLASRPAGPVVRAWALLHRGARREPEPAVPPVVSRKGGQLNRRSRPVR